MKLIDNVTDDEIILPDGLLWQDEFNWTKIKSTMTNAIQGSLIVQQGVMLEGQPITLGKGSADDMDWVTRSTLDALYTASQIVGRTFTLKLEYPTDTREFNVAFYPDDKPIESSPVKGFPEHEPDSWHHLTLRLIVRSA